MKSLTLLAASAALIAFGGNARAQDPRLGAAPGPSVAAVDEAGWRRVAPENLLLIDTTKGRIILELMPEAAPQHVERIRLLSRLGIYDGLVWHRVIDWFMAQTGDPLGTGEGQSAYPDLAGEFTFRRGSDLPFTAASAPTGAVLGFMNSLPVQTQPDALMAGTSDGKVHAWGLYCPGVAGMARDEDPDTANSQFFIMRQAYPSLDKRYTIWGMTLEGLDVVRALKAGTDPSGVVTEPDRMIRARVVADLPESERPVVHVMRADNPAFGGMVAQMRTDRGADFSVCDLNLPVQISPPPPPPPPAG
ncbi:MAG TPA: peptidylprolyl isomerase [Brevundimonas sp.]|uniref:peptidylprolyl isomerase n=1 Tax=Brevundimonas sp. TaxID=1871086 RepID=UPI002DF559AB|nr:peptidylprolyl isomerase [Brevundimonas sp.]